MKTAGAGNGTQRIRIRRSRSEARVPETRLSQQRMALESLSQVVS